MVVVEMDGQRLAFPEALQALSSTGHDNEIQEPWSFWVDGKGRWRLT